MTTSQPSTKTEPYRAPCGTLVSALGLVNPGAGLGGRAFSGVKPMRSGTLRKASGGIARRTDPYLKGKEIHWP